MNKLELCQEVLSRTGQSGTMTTTVGQRGMFRRISNWVREAYMDIQRMPIPWRWMRVRDVTGNLSPNKETYTAVELGLPNLRSFDLDSFSIHAISDAPDTASPMDGTKPWDTINTTYAVSMAPGTPRFVLAPEHTTLHVYPVPNDMYVIHFDYFKRPQVLAADTDVPEMPDYFHDLIVLMALKRYAAFDDAPEIMEDFQLQYPPLFRELYREQAIIKRKRIRLTPLA